MKGSREAKGIGGSAFSPSMIAAFKEKGASSQGTEFLIDNLLVQIHFIIVMIRWTGLAPWELVASVL